ncbi:ribonuclease H-like domain-containing protein [Tanacetum coccineum]
MRADGSAKTYLLFSQLLKEFDREDLENLWKLVKAKHGNTRPDEGYKRVLWGNLKTMFEHHIEDEVWTSLQGKKLLLWRLYDSCGVYFVRFEDMHVYMLVEKRYPLTPATITDMLNKKLKSDYWNEMCYQGRIVGIKSFIRLFGITTALIKVSAAQEESCFGFIQYNLGLYKLSNIYSIGINTYLILSKTIVHTDHSALKHLFKKQDAKPHLIRWILLLLEFDIEIKDRKGTKNVAADHLSRIENDEISDDSEVDDNFLGETLMEINTKDEPWFADFANYLVASSTCLLQRNISSSAKEFDMTDLGALNYFLGISVTRDSTGMFLSQKKYAMELLDRAHMASCNPTRTLYNRLQLYASSTSSLVAYSDADWAGCPTTRRSTSGYCVFFRDNLLSWSRKRQYTLFRSCVEVEYRGVANVVAETTWLRNLLCELHMPLLSATLVYYDNIDIHFVRDMVAHGHVRVLHVSSRYQYVDIFTKGLPSALFEEFCSSLSVRSSPARTAGEC